MFVAVLDAPPTCGAAELDVLLSAFDWKRFMSTVVPSAAHSHAYTLMGRAIGRVIAATDAHSQLFVRSLRGSVCGAVAALCALSPAAVIPSLLALLLKRLHDAKLPVHERWLEDAFTWPQRSAALLAPMPLTEDQLFDPRGQLEAAQHQQTVLDRCVQQLQQALGSESTTASSATFLNVLGLMTSLLRDHPQQLGRAELLIPLIQRSLEGPLTSLLMQPAVGGAGALNEEEAESLFAAEMSSIATGLETVFGLMSGLSLDAAWQLIWSPGSGVVAFLEKLDARVGRSEESFELVFNAVQTRLRELPWGSARLHHTEAGLASIIELLARSRVSQRLVLSLLATLTWPAEIAAQPTFVIHALTLLLDAHLLRAVPLPSLPLLRQPRADSPSGALSLAALVSSGLEQLAAAMVVSNDAVECFSKLYGESKATLIRLIECGRAVPWAGGEPTPADVSTELQENARFLVEVCTSVLGSQPAALLALVGEVQRCLYLTVLNATRSPLLIWHLPVPAHVALVYAVVKMLSAMSVRAAQTKPQVVGNVLQKAFQLMVYKYL